MDLDTESSESEPEDLGAMELTQTPAWDDLASLLECPVCYDLPLPPIRTCIQGHILCKDCALKVRRCPLCLLAIGNGRNYFAEEFIRQSIFACKFRGDGCMEGIRGEYFKEHVLNCDFSPIKCRLCSNKIRHSQFEEHLIQTHHISIWDLNDDGVRLLDYERQLSQNRHFNRRRRSSINPDSLHQFQDQDLQAPDPNPIRKILLFILLGIVPLLQIQLQPLSMIFDFEHENKSLGDLFQRHLIDLISWALEQFNMSFGFDIFWL